MKRLLYGMGVLLAALWITPLGAQQSTGTIRGRITDDASQRPVQGASVSYANHNAVTQSDGRYVLPGVPAGTDTLRVRMIGYSLAARAVSVAPGEAVDMDIAMTAQAVNLSEIVAIGYGEQAAGNITGAVTSVSAQQFNTGRIVSPTELIQSKVAGVQVVENNEPGGGTSIRIRGATSINASSDPLVVIDGMPVGGTGAGGGLSGGRDPLNFVNSQDIENITVLRDASAAAIYGANAANGVVLITTKHGQTNQKPRFEYSGTVSASSVTRLPSMLNAAQFRTAVQTYAPTNAGQLLNANTNWFDQVDRTAYGQEQNFAVSGAGTSMDYRFSANYLDQNGIIDATNTKRLTLGANYTQRLFDDRLKVKLNLRGSRASDQFTPGGVVSNAAQMGPTQPVKDPTTATGFYDWSGGLQSADNPVAILALATNASTTLRSIGNVQGEFRLPYIDGLSANLNLGYDVTKVDHTTFTPSSLHSEIKSGNGGAFFNENPSQLNTVLESYLSYAVPNKVGPGLLDVTGGYSYSKSHGEFPQVVVTNLTSDVLGPNGFPSSSSTPRNSLNVQDSKLISFFGRVNYNINDRYLAAVSVRRDGSSRFGAGNQWGTFPSFSGAWRISDESFLKGFTSLSDLKLRGSWAKTGNQSFGNYLQYSTYQYGDALSQYEFADSFFTTIRPSAVDPNIKWEGTRSIDLGFDFGFLNQRFTGAFDWYNKRTDDLIFRVPVAAGTNLGDFVTTNIGAMRNRGFEFSLSAKVMQGTGKHLSWTADLTASHNNNEMLAINPFAGTTQQQILVGSIAGGVGSTVEVLTPGKPIYSFFVYHHKRDANGKPIYADVNGDGSITDIDLYVDRNGDGIINDADKRTFHDPSPKWILGHSSYLTYGNWDLGFTLRAYLGNYAYNNVASNLGTYSEVTRGSPYNLHTSVLKTGFATPQYWSDYYVEKASFLRMDNITLGYSFNLRGQAARVFGTAQNVFTITGYSGVDPSGNIAANGVTSPVNGIDNNIYPRSRTFTGGLSLQF
jgi:TonB-dependent starch-binding outer membrane protein SusC